MSKENPIYKKIKDYVDSNGISRKLIANNACISESQLSLMLNGKRKISVDDYEALCKAMAVDPCKFYET